MSAELRVLAHYGWSVGHPTAAHFVDYFAVCAVSVSDRCYDRPIQSLDMVRCYMKKYIDYFLEISLQGGGVCPIFYLVYFYILRKVYIVALEIWF